MSQDPESNTPVRSNIPGGSIRIRPMEIEGEMYDPYHLPKLVTKPDGTRGYVGGRTIDRDEYYADRFWDAKRGELSPEGLAELRQVMIGNLEKALEAGEFSVFVPESGPPRDADRDKMAAYRALAKDQGFSMGKFVHKNDSPTAIAPISKVTPASPGK